MSKRQRKSSTSSGVYCGAKESPPSGRSFGTPEQCVNKKQVRRYGTVQVDPSILPKPAANKKSYVVEAVKLRVLNEKIKAFLNDVAMLDKKIAENPPDSKTYKTAVKQRNKINVPQKKRELLAKYTKQKNIVDALEKNQGDE